MKSIKLVLPLVILTIALGLAMPVVADQPGTNEDPFGGLPIGGTLTWGIGAPALFGLQPLGYALPGGTPSSRSGDGTTPRRAIYIGGTWTGTSGDPAGAETPTEVSNCGTLKIPAGKARWFKLDTWDDRRTQIWLDDELNGATKSSGRAVYGAADRYMLGTAPGDGWTKNAYDGGSQNPNLINGYVMVIYDPDNLKPMWAFNPPNAAILSVSTDAAGKLLNGPDNLSIRDVTGAGVEGYGSHNPNQPDHLLWYEGRFNGWVFVMIYNQMIWDDTATVCSIRVKDE